MSAGRVLFCRGEEDEADHDDIWDDTELIAAYDRALASARAELGMAGAAAEEKPSKKWRIGDFCRAVYSADGQWYEAEILSVGGARCRLRYVGYGNEEDQPLGRLQPSAGKKERRKQEREAEEEREAQEEGEEEAESEEDQGEAEEESRPAERAAGKSRRSAAERGVGSVQNPAAQGYTGSGQTRHSHSQQAGYPGAGPIPTYPAGQPTPAYPGWGPPWAPGPGSHGAPWGHRAGPWGAAPPWGSRAGYVGRAPDPYLPAYPPPPPPPPPVPGDADPVQLANMLMSWYISGYHTGYYQASREARK